jgi:thiamine-phosphate pyrophosphorylase
MKSYLITSKKSYKEQFAKHSPDYALYRDKSNLNYDTQAADFIKVCQEFNNIKSFIHQKVDLAKKLNARGVHLTSSQFDEIQEAKNKNLEVIISTHTHEEVLKAQKLGADGVTYSPIFDSPKKGEAKGIDDLSELLKKTNIKVFALGGIVTDEEIRFIKETSVYGFASIRYFN